MSDSTRRMIKRKTFVYDTFDWQEHESFVVPGTDTRVKTFVVEQIFVEVDSFSEEEDLNQLGAIQGER